MFGVRAVVLLEPHDVRVGEVLLEVEDVADVGAAPAVDRLVVVADDHQVAVPAAEQLHELVLRAVGVLVLVDEHVAEARAGSASSTRGFAREHLAPAARAGRRSRRRSPAAAPARGPR